MTRTLSFSYQYLKLMQPTKFHDQVEQLDIKIDSRDKKKLICLTYLDHHKDRYFLLAFRITCLDQLRWQPFLAVRLYNSKKDNTSVYISNVSSINAKLIYRLSE